MQIMSDKYVNKLICTDLDGTLFYPKSKFRLISSKNLKFLREFIDGGGRLAVVTGRTEHFCKKVRKKINRPIDFLACNGAVINVDGTDIRRRKFDNEKATNFIKKVISEYNPNGVVLFSKDNNMVANKTHMSKRTRIVLDFYYYSQGVYYDKMVLSDQTFWNDLHNGSVYKLMIYFGITKNSQNEAYEANKVFRNEHGNDYECNWVGPFIEITEKDISKGASIKFYCEKVGINFNDVHVVGDSGNDISMFKEFENSYCMKHSKPGIQKYARHIVRRVSDLKTYFETNKGE